MPLLRKAPFVRLPPPENLLPNDEIFFCKLTGEVFDDYDTYFQRIILCNSLVWTCAFTGRQNMTFSEALHSEKRAQERLNNIPTYLQSPLLYLAHLTHRTRLNDVVDDVFMYSKERYFLGESVFVTVSNERRSCKIVDVIPPDGDTSQVSSSSDESVRERDVICLGDELQPPQAKMIKLSESASEEDEDRSSTFGPSPLMYRYAIQLTPNSSSFTAEAKNISREEGLLSRDKCKCFLEQHCIVEEDGIWRVKAKYAKRFSLSTLSFSSFFAGLPPKFEICEAEKRHPSAKAFSDSETLAKPNLIDLTEEDEIIAAAEKVSKEKKDKEKATSSGSSSKAEKLKKKETEKMNVEDEFRRMRKEIKERAKKREEERLEKLKEKELRMEEMKKKADEQRQKRKEENEKKKLERKEQDALLREFNKPREDLECEDLKDLPAPTPVSCGIPNEAFGDAVLVLEYLICFQSFFEFNLPKNISVDTLAQALNDIDVDGLFADLVRELLSAIFHLQDEEQHEGNDEKDIRGLLDGLEEYEDKSSQDLVRAATVTSQLPVLNYGTPLRKLQLDGYTLTEVVRLHLLSSGSLNGISKYDYQQRGGYTVYDDPGLVFRQEEVSVIRALGERNIFDLTCVEKLKIISVLIHQLLTYVISRDVIDDNCERLKQVQKQLRLHQWAEQRRDKDETHFRSSSSYTGCSASTASTSSSAALSEADAARNIHLDASQPITNLQIRLADGSSSALKDKDDGKKQLDSSKQFLAALKAKDFENMPTENLNWDKISQAERAQVKEWYVRREKELMDLAVKLQHSHSICPIGRDRAFRRFWVFQSIPGLFVEDQEDLIPSEYFQPVAQTLAGKTTRVLSGNEDGSSEDGKSDKENFPVDGVDESSAATRSKDFLEKKASAQFASVYEKIVSRGKVRWAFYGSPEEVDTLIDSLNPRGVRESGLRSALVEQKERLKDWISKSSSQLCQGKPDMSETVQEKRAGPHSKQAVNVFTYNSAQECLENNLREMLLDIEERIDAGSLGSLKVNNRDEWRRALEDSRHDSQSTSLMGAGKPEGYPKEEHQQNVDVGLSSCGGSREVVSSVVRDLASSLLQIERMIDHRYFAAPLGNEALKKAKLKAVLDAAFRDGGRSSRDRKDQDSKKEVASVESDDDGSSTGTAQCKTALERWEESLTSSTSLPQIFLHLAVLESSIMWPKSALHARCRICRRKGDGERMLLCDICDRGHHMYCLKPPVKHIPQGDWFCPSCRPKDVLHSPRKQRKSFDEAISVDDESESVSAASESRNDSVDEGDDASGEDDENDSEQEEEEEENSEEEEDWKEYYKEEGEEDSDVKSESFEKEEEAISEEEEKWDVHDEEEGEDSDAELVESESDNEEEEEQNSEDEEEWQNYYAEEEDLDAKSESIEKEEEENTEEEEQWTDDEEEEDKDSDAETVVGPTFAKIKFFKNKSGGKKTFGTKSRVKAPVMKTSDEQDTANYNQPVQVQTKAQKALYWIFPGIIKHLRQIEQQARSFTVGFIQLEDQQSIKPVKDLDKELKRLLNDCEQLLQDEMDRSADEDILTVERRQDLIDRWLVMREKNEALKVHSAPEYQYNVYHYLESTELVLGHPIFVWYDLQKKPWKEASVYEPSKVLSPAIEMIRLICIDMNEVAKCITHLRSWILESTQNDYKSTNEEVEVRYRGIGILADLEEICDKMLPAQQKVIERRASIAREAYEKSPSPNCCKELRNFELFTNVIWQESAIKVVKFCRQLMMFAKGNFSLLEPAKDPSSVSVYYEGL